MFSPRLETTASSGNNPSPILKKAISKDGSQYSFTTSAGLVILNSGKQTSIELCFIVYFLDLLLHESMLILNHHL